MSHLVWDEDAASHRARSYEITSRGPGDWVLFDRGRARSHHNSATSAKLAAERLERRRLRKRALIRHLAVGAGTMLLFVILAPGRMVANTAYEPARAFAADMEAAFRSIVAGTSDVADVTVPTHGFAGATLRVEPIEIGGLDMEQRAPTTLHVLVGRHGGDCYVVRWPVGDRVATGVLSPGFPCEAGIALASSSSYTRTALTVSLVDDAARVLNWEGALPPPETQARWFLVLAAVVAVVVLNSFVSITLVALGKGPYRLLAARWPTAGRRSGRSPDVPVGSS